MKASTHPSPLALALGRIPTGLYVVAASTGHGPVGFVGSFVMQVAFDPPTLCVAIQRDRAHLEAIRSAGCFAVSVLDAASRGLMGAFFRRYPAGESAFDHVPHTTSPLGAPILPDALAWLDCRANGEHAAGDHVVVFGRVEGGACLRTADPAVHLRVDGLAY
jgi:flavin reductase (DIM6/NTAB) family NADH-FMN oxidoreductase RutF